MPLDASGPLGATQNVQTLAGVWEAGSKSLPAPPLRFDEHLSEHTRRAIGAYFAGRRGGARSALLFAGPAVLASTAYMDPGNFAVNIEAGAIYGYNLLWVVLLANIIAMLFQALSAKLGIATGQNLAELCRQHYPAPVSWAMWLGSELAAMATDLPEFLGGAIGLSLLFNMSLLSGMPLSAAQTYGTLGLDRWGFRPTEILLSGFVAVIRGFYVPELSIVPVDWTAATAGSLIPK